MSIRDLFAQIASQFQKLEEENKMLKKASIDYEKSRKGGGGGSPRTTSPADLSRNTYIDITPSGLQPQRKVPAFLKNNNKSTTGNP